MTTIDDSNTTPPGYWFGEIEHRLRSRMRDELRELGLRRGGWRVLHLLADGPASAEELSERLPTGRRGHHGHGGERGHGERGHGERRDPRAEWMRGHAEAHHPHPGYNRADCAHAEDPHGPGHEHGHDRPRDHHHHHDHSTDHSAEGAFERGFVRGFDRGARFHRPPFGPFGPVPPFGRGHGRGFGHRRPGMVDRVLADFVERGWVWFDGDRATLTDEGRAAHDAAFERVRSVRSSLADGVDEQDLATTLATLQAMARNLGWTPSDAHSDEHGDEHADEGDSPDTSER
ncbi:hypothetical protein [Leifsonia sp. NPDC080035]|uniref:HTH marR-type domain-containing protein n=1 Tax=Leifsonia sp. NPDC080035 TaxID=3143936 RepID=A0AAU7GGT8_9MICO